MSLPSGGFWLTASPVNSKSKCTCKNGLFHKQVGAFSCPKMYCKAAIFLYFSLPMRFAQWVRTVNPKYQIFMGFSWGRKEKNWLWMSRRVKMRFSPSQHVHGVFLWVVVRKWACERHKWWQQVGVAAGFVSDAQLSLDSRSALTAISLWCVLSGLVLTMLWGCQSLILYANVLCCCVCYPAQERGTARASCLHWIFECVPGQ